MPRFRVTLSAASDQAIADLIRKHKINVFDHGTRRRKGVDPKAARSVDALADDQQIKMLQSQGYGVQVHEDVDAAGKLRQREVGQGNRYKTSPRPKKTK
jgi:hypothetical protein